VGVRYGSPTERVAELVQKVLDENENVLQEPRPEIIFEDFGDNALIFDAYFWCRVRSELELRRIRSEVRFRIDRLFRESDIVIAYPQRDVHLDTERPLEIRLERAGGSGIDERAQSDAPDR
jgi:small-conductance mechanosensitive channel